MLWEKELFVDLLTFLEKYMPDEATKKIIRLSKEMK